MSWVSTTYNAMRTSFGAREMRHNGHLYTFPPAPAQNTAAGGGMVLHEGAEGVLRLLVSELKKPYPAPGDTIDIKDIMTGAWKPYTCLAVDPQHGGETLVINYGTQYAG